MRKVIAGLAVTLDGFIEGTQGEYDWCFTDQDYGLSEFMKEVDAIFMGRKSFEAVHAMGGTNPWSGITTYVFSNRLRQAPAGSLLLRGNLTGQVQEIKNQTGKNIWLFGGAELINSMMTAGLVDELWLSVHPILLGSGKQLFKNFDRRIKLNLMEAKTYSTGLVSLRYQVEHR